MVGFFGFTLPTQQTPEQVDRPACAAIVVGAASVIAKGDLGEVSPLLLKPGEVATGTAPKSGAESGGCLRRNAGEAGILFCGVFTSFECGGTVVERPRL